MVSAAGTPKVVEWADSGIAAAYAGWLLAGLGADVVRLGELPDPKSDPLLVTRITLDAAKTSLPAQDWAVVLDDADILLCDDLLSLEAKVGPLDDLASRFPRLVIGIHSIFGIGLVALSVRDRDGHGQIVDIALADVLARYVGGNCRFYIHHGMRWQRSGQRASDSGGAYPFERIKSPVEIPVYGPKDVFRAPWKFSRTEAQIDLSGPKMGEHNRMVLEGILGLADAKIKKLIASGAIA